MMPMIRQADITPGALDRSIAHSVIPIALTGKGLGSGEDQLDEFGVNAQMLANRDLDTRIYCPGSLRLGVDPLHQDASIQEVGDDKDLLGAQADASVDPFGDEWRSGPGEAALDQTIVVPFPEQSPDLEKVSIGLGVARTAADQKHRCRFRVADEELALELGEALLGDFQQGAVDTKRRSQTQIQARMAGSSLGNLAWHVFLRMTCIEQEYRNSKDATGTDGNTAVDRLLNRRNLGSGEF